MRPLLAVLLLSFAAFAQDDAPATAATGAAAPPPPSRDQARSMIVTRCDARRGVNFAGSDPRTDGAAIPEQPAAPPLPATVR
jgi:hypothetical protein